MSCTRGKNTLNFVGFLITVVVAVMMSTLDGSCLLDVNMMSPEILTTQDWPRQDAIDVSITQSSCFVETQNFHFVIPFISLQLFFKTYLIN